MTRSLYLKLILTVVTLLAITGAASEYLVGRVAANNYRSDLDASLLRQAKLARALLAATPPELLRERTREIQRLVGARVTVITSNGAVVGESDADLEEMENHAGRRRPEFAAALSDGVGYDTRRSGTIGRNLRYCAVAMPGGAVRLAVALEDVENRVAGIRGQILRALIFALIPAMILTAALSRRVSRQLSQVIGYARRLAEGDFQARLPRLGSSELGELADTLQSAGGQLRSMFEQLQDERSRFAAAVNGIGEGILAADKKLRVVLFNPAMEQMLPPGQQLYKGASLEEWDRKEIPRLFKEVLETGEACSVDITVEHPVERSWKISCAPILSRKGKVQAVVAVFYDITELEHVDRMRKDFVINVSHELRTPLAAIQGYAETLLDGAIDDASVNRRFMKILWQNAERLAQLTADLMTLSQIEVNTREFNFTPHKARDLLQQAADSIRTIAEKRSIAILVEPTVDELVADCDAGAIHQVLNNLLDNAAKYTPEGGEVRLGAVAKGERVEFFVRDNGLGIPAEHIPRLFERFYRVDKARSRELGGTGLGLAIVKHLVLAHRGGVRVTSEPGVGSTFYFEIPVKAAAEPAEVDPRRQALF